MRLAHPPASGEHGFTLIEVLVALVVTSLLLAVVFQGSTAALARLHATDDRRAALIYGRYLLLRGSVLDYGGGNGQGRDGQLSWTSDEHLVMTDNRRFNALMRIHVAIRDAHDRLLFDQSVLRMKLLPQR
jgi:prepilin-type N-terminal cleavage/methylation domain-containing protein